MADVAPPLASRPGLHSVPSDPRSTTSSTFLNKHKSPTPITVPSTPEQDRSTDPLSAHILARAHSSHPDSHESTPLFKRNLSEISSFIKDTAATLRDDVVAGSPLAQNFVTPETTAAENGHAKGSHEPKHVSFFSKLRGKAGVGGDDYKETEEQCQRAEGGQAETFCKSGLKPKYIRVRSHGKSKRDFDHVFLAQELRCATDDAASERLSQPDSTAAAIWALEFSADGKYLAAGGQDGIVRVWRVISSAEDRRHHDSYDKTGLCAPVVVAEPYRIYKGHTSDVLDICWSKRNFLLTSSMDKTVRLWHASRDECLCSFQHKDFVTSIAFHPSDDRFFLSGSLDCKLRLWDIVDKQVSFWNELPELVTAVSFSPDGRLAIAGTFTGMCLFYETEGLRYHTQIHVRSSRGRNSKGSKITGVQTTSLTPDMRTSEVKLLITSNDSRIRLYTMRDKALEAKFKGNVNQSSQIRGKFNEGCRYVICGSEDRQVYIWNTSGELGDRKDKRGVEHFEASGNVVTATCFAPHTTRDLLLASKDPIYERVFALIQNKMHPGDSSIRTGRSSGTSHATGQSHEHSWHNSADGNIIAIADARGVIKIFRQDYAATLAREDRADVVGILKKRSTMKLNGGSTAGSIHSSDNATISRSESDASLALKSRSTPSSAGRSTPTSKLTQSDDADHVVKRKSTLSSLRGASNGKSGRLSPTAEDSDSDKRSIRSYDESDDDRQEKGLVLPGKSSKSPAKECRVLGAARKKPDNASQHSVEKTKPQPDKSSWLKCKRDDSSKGNDKASTGDRRPSRESQATTSTAASSQAAHSQPHPAVVDNFYIDESGASMGFYDPHAVHTLRSRPRAFSTSTYGSIGPAAGAFPGRVQRPDDMLSDDDDSDHEHAVRSARQFGKNRPVGHHRMNTAATVASVRSGSVSGRGDAPTAVELRSGDSSRRRDSSAHAGRMEFGRSSAQPDASQSRDVTSTAARRKSSPQAFRSRRRSSAAVIDAADSDRDGSRAGEDNDQMKCPHCDGTSFRATKLNNASGGVGFKLVCIDCGRYVV